MNEKKKRGKDRDREKWSRLEANHFILHGDIQQTVNFNIESNLGLNETNTRLKPINLIKQLKLWPCPKKNAANKQKWNQTN